MADTHGEINNFTYRPMASHLMSSVSHHTNLVCLCPLVFLIMIKNNDYNNNSNNIIDNENNNNNRKDGTQSQIFIIKGFRTIVFIVISTTFRPICPLAFTCLSNSRTFTELRTTSFIKSKGVTCSDSVGHNRVQVLSLPVMILASNLPMIVSLEA